MVVVESGKVHSNPKCQPCLGQRASSVVDTSEDNVTYVLSLIIICCQSSTVQNHKFLHFDINDNAFVIWQILSAFATRTSKIVKFHYLRFD